MKKITETLEYTPASLVKKIMENDYLQADESPIKVLEIEKKGSTQKGNVIDIRILSLAKNTKGTKKTFILMPFRSLRPWREKRKIAYVNDIAQKGFHQKAICRFIDPH